MISTLMLSPQFGEDSNRLRTAALARQWEVIRWTNWQVPPGLKTEQACLYSSDLFAERVSQLTGLHFDEPAEDWLIGLSPELLKRKVEFVTLAQARNRTDRAFYKPAAFKTFKAAVYNSGSELALEGQADGSSPVLISEVVHWQSEFRFFLLDGQALTGSVYFRSGESAQGDGSWPCDESEFRIAKETAELAYAASRHGLPRSVVIDTGYIRGEGWAVVEANPSWGSGLYGCDAEAVLTVIAEAVTH